MIAEQLWLPGWDTEPCHDSPPDLARAAYLDRHEPAPRAADRPRPVTLEYGRPRHGTSYVGIHYTTIKIMGSYL